MSLSTKILIIAGTIISLCIASLIVYKQFEITQQQRAIQTEMVKQKELQDGIIRSLNEYATKKDIEQFAKNNNIALKTITDDMSKLNAELKSINIITANSGTPPKTNMPSTSVGAANPNPQTPTVDCNGKVIPCPDQFGYLKATQNYKLYEQFGNVRVPVGTASFSAWRENPWDENVSTRQYKVSNVVGVDENQRQYFYNKFTVTTEGKTYDIKIDSAETKQEYPMAKFHFPNPRLHLGIDAGVNLSKTQGAFVPNVSIGIISFGKFKSQPDISLLQLGVGYDTVDKKIQTTITPVTYNVGKHIPFMNNLYVGPSLHINTSGDISIMGGLKAAL